MGKIELNILIDDLSPTKPKCNMIAKLTFESESCERIQFINISKSDYNRITHKSN
jgi:hypothetical protein